MKFSHLSDAQLERLAILAEEAGEVCHAIGKIIRHGYHRKHPSGGMTNRESLEAELGDLSHAIDRMVEARDVRRGAITDYRDIKAASIGQYLHHQKPEKRRARA